MKSLELINRFEGLTGFAGKQAGILDSGTTSLSVMKNAIGLGYEVDSLLLGAANPLSPGSVEFVYVLDAGNGEYLVGANSDKLQFEGDIVTNEKEAIERVGETLNMIFKLPTLSPPIPCALH